MAKKGAAALSIGLGAVILYLGAHAVTGRQGLVAYVDLQARERVLEARVVALSVERAALQTRAARLAPATLDLDYLDERARVLLSMGEREEVRFALDE